MSRFLAAEFVAGALQVGVGDLGPWLLECAASSWWSQVRGQGRGSLLRGRPERGVISLVQL